MDWDDEYDNGYDDMDYASNPDGSIPDKNVIEGFDRTDIVN